MAGAIEPEATAGASPRAFLFVRDAAGIRAAAISETAVVAERVLPVDWMLVNDIVQRMTDPEDIASIPDMSRLMARLFVPGDFREKLGTSESLILDLDRDTSRIQWEMMDSLKGTERPLALDGPVARQLRTSYSPTPPPPLVPVAQLRALVIGDPGDPAKGYDLEGARCEAVEVAQLLSARGVHVDLLVGAPNAPLAGVTPATKLEVLRLLEKNTYDVMHYAGHGNFDPDDPEKKAGWLFGDQYFTARDLASVSRVPSLVVANACLSGLTSNKHGYGVADSGTQSRLRAADDNLLPGLADEFFKHGVRNYVGTAWPVSDTGAILFCTTLYAELLAVPAAGQQATIGEALLQARRALKDREASFGALWAAYQHYGDPAFALQYALDDSA